MEIDNDAAAWAGFAAFFLPLVMSVINQPQWSSQLKSGLAFLACIGVAAVAVWVEGDWNSADIVSTSIVVLTVAQSTYHGLWKPSGIAPGVEAGTSGVFTRPEEPRLENNNEKTDEIVE